MASAQSALQPYGRRLPCSILDQTLAGHQEILAWITGFVLPPGSLAAGEEESRSKRDRPAQI